MRRAFADTFYYLGLLNPRDEAHDQVIEFTKAFTGTMVTTDWVITELADALSDLANRRTLVEFVESLRVDPAVRIVPAGRRLLNKAWDLYQRRLDKEWSLTDCTSFVVMRERGLTTALTGDRHFEQAGFQILLE